MFLAQSSGSAVRASRLFVEIANALGRNPNAVPNKVKRKSALDAGFYKATFKHGRNVARLCTVSSAASFMHRRKYSEGCIPTNRIPLIGRALNELLMFFFEGHAQWAKRRRSLQQT
jgi:hypothetical protein